ncbi:MAG: hypothetical protein ACPGJS_21850 [Flammeovirgaceae bacterium]
MYFEGTLTIDPSQLTHIEAVKPTQAFKRVFYYLTFGGVTEKLERETFTAVAILQQLNTVMARCGVNNIIRLSHDGIDFYLDQEGKTDDLKEALELYGIEVDPAMSQHFDQLLMILEHDDANFKYLFEVTINRTHDVGAYPIEIKVSGLLNELQSETAPSIDNVKEQMKDIFKSQESYQAYKLEKLSLFRAFLENLKLNISKYIQVDDVQLDVKTKVVIPKKKIQAREDLTTNRQSGYYGVHYGYYGFDNVLLYSLLWSDMCHDHNIVLENSFFESELGDDYGYQESVDTSSDYFDSDVPFEEKADFFSVDSDTTKNQGDVSNNWFDFDFGGDDGGSAGSDCSSCSSCSSCASCGGD